MHRSMLGVIPQMGVSTLHGGAYNDLMVDLVLWLMVQHVLNHVHFEGFQLRQELLFLLIAPFFNLQIYLSLKGGGGAVGITESINNN